MRNRGLSKIYVIAGLVAGVIVLMLAVRIVLLQIYPERHNTSVDPELRLPADAPKVEQSGSLGGPNDVNQTEKSTSPNP